MQVVNILNCITTFCCSEAVNVGYVDVGYNYDLGGVCVTFACCGTTFEAGVYVSKFWEFLLQ